MLADRPEGQEPSDDLTTIFVHISMAISWAPREEAELTLAFNRYPAESDHCVELARVVLRCALRSDAAARNLQVVPKGQPARFVVPRRAIPRAWATHVTTETRAHCVDALTGISGCETGRYLETHWRYPEFLQLQPVDPRDLARQEDE